MVEKKIKEALKKRTIILGVGNPERRDDGVGIYLASRLMGRVHARVLNCEEIPECFTDVVRDFAPDTVMILDAVHMNRSPGAVAVFKDSDILKTGHSNHNASIELLMKYLAEETGAEVLLVGIQPENTNHGRKMTPYVRNSADELYTLMTGRNGKCCSVN